MADEELAENAFEDEVDYDSYSNRKKIGVKITELVKERYTFLDDLQKKLHAVFGSGCQSNETPVCQHTYGILYLVKL